MRTANVLVLGLTLVSCTTSAESIIVSLRTDYSPGEDFREVRLSLAAEPAGTSERSQIHRPGSGDYARGVRIGDFEGVPGGTYRLRAELVSPDGRLFASRQLVFEAVGALEVTVVLARSCEGVECPLADPALSECSGGRCVDPRCSPESPENCESGCTSDSQCSAPVPCLESECTAEGACLTREREGACGAEGRCDRNSGCVATADVGAPDRGLGDAGLADEGVEIRVDGGDETDAGPCGSPGACEPADVETRGCGNCGVQTRVCNAACAWNAWGACSGEGVCAAGEEENEACGSCGSRRRTCSESCGWNDWSPCAGEGVCAPGASESCGSTCQARVCSDSCDWGACTGCSCTGETTCGASCAAGFHVERRFCQTRCGGNCTSGLPNSVRCEPNCGDRFVVCLSGCPEGYYAAGRGCFSQCSRPPCTSGSNGLDCRQTGASQIAVCGNFCPTGYERNGSVCIPACGTCSGTNGSRCRRL